MEQLFLTMPAYAPPESFEKTAYIKLSDIPEEWESQIVRFSHEALPDIGDRTIKVAFHRMDPLTKTALGRIEVDNTLVIPLIVKEGRLYPLDLMYTKQGRLEPLSRDSLRKQLEDVSIGRPIEPTSQISGDMSLHSATQPPFAGRYVLAALETATRSALGQDMTTFFGFNPMFKEAFTALAKYAKEQASAPEPTETTKQDVIPLAYREYTPLGAAGTYMLRANNAPKVAAVFDRVVTLRGTPVDGHLIYTADHELLLDRNGVGGVRGGDIDMMKKALRHTRPASYGFFADPATGVATEPFRVEYTSGTQGVDKIVGLSVSGHKTAVVQDSAYKSASRVGETLFIPATWLWFEGKEPAHRFVKSAEANDAQLPQSRMSVRAVKGGLYVVTPKLASFPEQGGTARDLVAALAASYTKEAVAKVMATLEKTGAAHFTPVPVASTPAATKVAGKTVRAVNLFREAAYVMPVEYRDPFRNMRKIAVSDADVRTSVDTILGLNFLTPDNQYRFIQKLGLLEDARSCCAELVMASRLGLPVEAAPLQTAAQALDRIVNDMQEYRGTLNAS